MSKSHEFVTITASMLARKRERLNLNHETIALTADILGRMYTQRQLDQSPAKCCDEALAKALTYNDLYRKVEIA